MHSPAHAFRHRFRLVAGCILVALGLGGFSTAFRAACAQRMYLRGKYGLFRGTRLETPRCEDAEEARDIARRASALYDANYYLPSWAAGLSLAAARTARSPSDFEQEIAGALYFAREAISLNPYDAGSRLVWAESLAESGRVDEAISFWEGIVEREFWNPDNHDEFVRLLLRQGSREALARAVRERPLVSDPALRRRLQRLETTLNRTRNR